MRTFLSPLLLCSGLMASTAASAHQIWFEPSQGGDLVLRYGEYDENALEVTPGGMDRFKALQAAFLVPGGQKPIALALRRDRFDVSAKPGTDDSLIAVDRQYPIFQNHFEGRTVIERWTVATRWVGDLRPRKAELELDVLPTGSAQGNKATFQVVLRGKPLAGQEVNLESASGWDHSGKTGRDGTVSFELPWKGTYVLGVEPLLAEGGVRDGLDHKKEPYEATGFSTTLSFTRTTGLEPLPRAVSTLPKSEKIRLHQD